MPSGLKTLHQIDAAIVQARANVSEASKLPGRVSAALADINRKRAKAYGHIAKVRLEDLDDGDAPGDLGYVDRQAVKLLAAHEEEEARIGARIDDSLAVIAKIEADRRMQEKKVAAAIDAYDKTAQACQKKLIANPDYIALLTAVDTAEATTVRARAKQELAERETEEKGAPYRADKYFQYLQNRRYGTKAAKGWFLTKMLDGWIARRGGYRDAAVNYQKLLDIPVRLAAHVERLEAAEESARLALAAAEETALTESGAAALKDASLSEQAKLDAIDSDLEGREAEHQELRSRQSAVSGGDSVSYRKALDLLVSTLERKDLPSLQRLAAQTISRDDDQAVQNLAALADNARDLQKDQAKAQTLLKKYQKSLAEMEKLRRRFKSKRYDAPSSDFPGNGLIAALLGQAIAGLLDGDDIWEQIKRAQRTVRRRTDGDFGGVDWGEAMRLPRTSGGWGRSSGGWGGGGRPRRSSRRSPQIRIPRTRMPKIKFPSGGGGGGFRTGGGF